MSIIIPGFTPSYKVPTIAAINQFGAGRQSIGSFPLACVCFGNKGTAGDALVNQRYQITTPEEADARFDPRSELARQLHAALETGEDTLTLYGVAVTEAAGVAATMPIDIGGSWTLSGEITIQLDEEIIRVPVAASHTPTTFGDALEDAINGAQNGRLFCTAVNVAGRVTLTVYTLGVRGNLHLAFLDSSAKPAGMTIAFDAQSDVIKVGTGPAVTVSGTTATDVAFVITITTGGANGTAQFSITGNAVSIAAGVTVPTTPFTYPVPGTGTGVTVTFGNGTHVLNDTHSWNSTAGLANGGRPFYGGTGTDDIEDALDATDTVTNDYIAPAHNDAVNVAKLETHVFAKAAFDVARLETYVVATNRTMANAISIGQTTMNDVLGQLVWAQDHVEHPSRMAARVAAMRSVTEGGQPNSNWDNVAIRGAAPHYRDADSPNGSTQNAALNASVTPLVTVNGELRIVRAIGSHSLNGVTPDDRTYDVSETVVPIRVRKELAALGQTLREANPYAGPDVGVGLPPEGTFTPMLWISQATRDMKQWESEQFNWLTDVDANPIQAEWDSVGKRVMSIVPTIVKSHFHSLGIIVRQTAA